MAWMVAFVTFAGFNLTFWGIVGVMRFVSERLPQFFQKSSHGIAPSFLNAIGRTRSHILFFLLASTVSIGWFGIFTVAVSALHFSSGLGSSQALVGLAGNSGSVPLVVLPVWILCGLLGGFVAARFFRVRNGLVFGLIGVVYALIARWLIERFFGVEITLDGPEVAFGMLLSFASTGASTWLASPQHRATNPISAQPLPKTVTSYITPFEVAAIIPAHNEELTVATTITALQKNLPLSNIYVGSDGSSDRTVEIARSSGCNVLDIQPNGGKAAALVALIRHFNLLDRYQAILIVDADTEVCPEFVTRALRHFKDPGVAAVAGHAITRWMSHVLPRFSFFFTAYRVRLYRVLQLALRYAQTWRYTNVTSIVPGFCSMYRTSALRQISIDAPGLIIEDYNMTFELHHKRLGRIAYDPSVFGLTDDPHSFRDYLRQVRRWNLGFWQTIRRHGFWLSTFSAFLSLYIVEIFSFSLLFLLLPILIGWFALHSFLPLILPFSIPPFSLSQLTVGDVLIGLFAADYLLTLFAAIIEKKPLLLLYGIGFFVLRYIDALMFLITLPLAFIVNSRGNWVSPKRTAATAV